MDIKHILDEWEYDPYSFSVRIVEGDDGKQKVQIRLDLGVLQLEMEGRPDGASPFNRESLLDYYTEKIEESIDDPGSGFELVLSDDDCDQLRLEAIQYYHRYVSLLELEKYNGVISDTEHNLGILNLLKQYAEDKSDSMSYEQYRPYILMINTLAKGRIALKKNRYKSASKIVDKGIKFINKAREELDLQDSLYGIKEIKFLEAWKKDIFSETAPSELDEMQRKLVNAVRLEDYESAAIIRDDISKIKVKNKKKINPDNKNSSS